MFNHTIIYQKPSNAKWDLEIFGTSRYCNLLRTNGQAYYPFYRVDGNKVSILNNANTKFHDVYVEPKTQSLKQRIILASVYQV